MAMVLVAVALILSSTVTAPAVSHRFAPRQRYIGASAPLSGPLRHPNCSCVPASLCRPLDTPHPSREIFGAYIHDRTIPHLNYSGLTTLFIGPPATLDPAVICAAHAHGVRVVSSVGFPGALLGPPGPFNPAYAATPAARASWVRHVLYGNGSASSPGVATVGLDGVLVDIEKYKGNRSTLTALIAELAVELKAWHPSSQLSFALSVMPGSQSSYYDHLALSRLIDYVFVMAYDEWPFEAWPNGTTVAAANSDLRTLQTALASYKTIGVPPGKLVMGLPWYGYDFPCDDNATGPPPPEGAPCLSSGAGKTPIKERAVLDQLKSMAPHPPTMFRGNASASLYFDFQCTNQSKECPSGRANTGGALLGRHQIWWDDASTLRQKYEYCRTLGVLGVGVYSLDFVSYETSQGAANWAALTDVWPRPAQPPTVLKTDDGAGCSCSTARLRV
jgi:di-N-acetylchitobiase